MRWLLKNENGMSLDNEAKMLLRAESCAVQAEVRVGRVMNDPRLKAGDFRIPKGDFKISRTTLCGWRSNMISRFDTRPPFQRP